MNIVIFGLTVSSSWGNGHATLWRSLIKALGRRGHRVRFYEKDVPYYAAARDLTALADGAELVLYADFEDIRRQAEAEIDRADLAIVTSYCPDGQMAANLVLESAAAIKCFYDLDTPVTLDALARGAAVPYLPLQGLSGFDLVLSYTGGRALEELQTKLGARFVAPLYGSVDPELHMPVAPRADLRCGVSYLGTYAKDRQDALERLFLDAALAQPNERYLICGSLYPNDVRWPGNVAVREHLPPQDHATFFCSSRLTLNLTRGSMAAYGYCPSGRLFEAAACGSAMLSDTWEGLDSFFEPGEEILLVRSTEEVLAATQRSDASLARVGEAARARVLAEHTGDARVRELERLCDVVLASTVQRAAV